jgi:hypothetical protein
MKRKYFTRSSTKNNKNNELQKSDSKNPDTTGKKNKGFKNKTSKNEASESNRDLGSDNKELGSGSEEDSDRLNDQEQSSSLSEDKLKGK